MVATSKSSHGMTGPPDPLDTQAWIDEYQARLAVLAIQQFINAWILEYRWERGRPYVIDLGGEA